MNARIIKETRSLLPIFCVTLLASVAPRLIWGPETAGGAGLAIFTFCCVFMGAGCFGNEYQWRTMPLLLAQPVPRQKIWHEKVLVLGCALALGLAFFLLCVPLPEKDSYLFLAVVPFCVLCVAPYMALQIKNTFIAAVLTFALPFGICGALKLATAVFSRFFPQAGELLDTSIQNHAYAYAITATVVYCGVYYRLGYRNFMKLEAVFAQAKEVSLPRGMESALAGPVNRLLPRYRSPWTSLLRKELQVQKAAFALAAIMFLVSILMALVRDIDRNADHAEFLAAMTIVPIVVLVFIFPFITPAGCVAEERNWGVSGWQRALPVSSRKQWAAKMAVVVFVSVLLGVVLPAVLWMADGWVFHLPFGPGPMHWRNAFTLPPLPELLAGIATASYVVLAYLFILSLGVFTSSLCTNSAKAVIMNLGLIIASGVLAAELGKWLNWMFGDLKAIYHLMEARPGNANGQTNNPIGGVLIIEVVCICLIILVQRLAFSNYRGDEPTSRRFWTQLIGVTMANALGLAICWFVVYAQF